MESQLFKALLAFVGIMVAAFLVIGANKETPQQKLQGAFLQTSSLLSSLALEKCSQAVKNEAGANPYTPFESDSDRMTYVKLLWKDVGTVKLAECRYVMDQGITLLKIDDRTVIAKESTQSAAAGADRPVHH